MRRLGAIFLICAFAALGSGLLLHVHNAAHAAHTLHAAGQHGAAGQYGAAGHHGSAGENEPYPADERTCDLHGKLAAPVYSAGVTPLLIAGGMFVAFITQLAPVWVSAFAQRRIDCRGPPVC